MALSTLGIRVFPLVSFLLVGNVSAQRPFPTGLPIELQGRTNITAADYSERSGLSERDIVEQAFRQIENEAGRLDRLIDNAEIVAQLAAFLVVAMAGIVSVFGYKSISDLKRDLQDSVEGYVDLALRKESERRETFEGLVDALTNAETRWEAIRSSVANIDKFNSLTESLFGDPHGAFKAVHTIANKDNPTEDDRRVALTMLGKLIQLGEEGRVDPNVLFNASSAASTLDFSFEAVKLSSLCAHWDPKPSHIAKKHRLEDVFGIRFSLRDGRTMKDDVPAALVRQEAWEKVLELLRLRPTLQCELIYSEAHNLAVRNREAGRIDELIQVIDNLTYCSADAPTPSYAYVILAGLYAMRGNKAWRENYQLAVETAIQRLKDESPMATWYGDTIRDLLQNASRLGELPGMMKTLDEAGIKPPAGED